MILRRRPRRAMDRETRLGEIKEALKKLAESGTRRAYLLVHARGSTGFVQVCVREGRFVVEVSACGVESAVRDRLVDEGFRERNRALGAVLSGDPDGAAEAVEWLMTRCFDVPDDYEVLLNLNV